MNHYKGLKVNQIEKHTLQSPGKLHSGSLQSTWLLMHSLQSSVLTWRQSSNRWQVPKILSKVLHWHPSVLWHCLKHSLRVLEVSKEKSLENIAEILLSYLWSFFNTLIMSQLQKMRTYSFDSTRVIWRFAKSWQDNGQDKKNLCNCIHFKISILWFVENSNDVESVMQSAFIIS